MTEPHNQTFERSVAFYGDWLAGHERVHCEQIEQVVAAVSEPAFVKRLV